MTKARNTMPAARIIRAIQDEIANLKSQGADHLMWEHRAPYAKFLDTVRVWKTADNAVTVNVCKDADTSPIPGLIDRATAAHPLAEGEIVPASNGYTFTW